MDKIREEDNDVELEGDDNDNRISKPRLSKKRKINDVEAQNERKKLIDEARHYKIQRTSLQDNYEDPISADVHRLSNEELKLLIMNYERQMIAKRTLAATPMLVKTIDSLLLIATNDKTSCKGAIDDQELMDDMSEYIYSYVGYIPSALWIVARLVSHITTSSSEVVTTDDGTNSADEKQGS